MLNHFEESTASGIVGPSESRSKRVDMGSRHASTMAGTPGDRLVDQSGCMQHSWHIDVIKGRGPLNHLDVSEKQPEHSQDVCTASCNAQCKSNILTNKVW